MGKNKLHIIAASMYIWGLSPTWIKTQLGLRCQGQFSEKRAASLVLTALFLGPPVP